MTGLALCIIGHLQLLDMRGMLAEMTTKNEELQRKLTAAERRLEEKEKASGSDDDDDA